MAANESLGSRASDLSDVLREYLVRCGNDRSRQQLALRLAREGMAERDLRELCEAMDARGLPETQTAAHIGQVLKTEESWREFLHDIAYGKAQQAARGGRSRGWRKQRGPVNMPKDLEADRADRRKTDEEYVRERVLVDGISPAVVADQMGWPVEEVRRVIGPRKLGYLAGGA